jgi:putative membrane protein
MHNQFLRAMRVAGAAATMALALTSGTANTANKAGNDTSAEKEMIGGADKIFMTDAAEGGLAEVQIGQMAQQKGSSQEVKDFGRRLEQDHQKANDQLKTIAQQRHFSLPTDTDAKHKAAIAKLNGLSGAEFDKVFGRMMVKDHREDIKKFERESNNGMDTDLKNFASSNLPTLKEHLQMAEQINGSTRSRKADKSSGSSGNASSSSSSSSSGTTTGTSK